MHSGWGILVAVTDANPVELAERRRIVVADPGEAGAKQPYHYAANLPPAEAEGFLAIQRGASEALALAEIGETARGLSGKGYRIAGCAIVAASGRPLPTLDRILGSHALIHTAEGEFFRETIRKACARLGIETTCIREKEFPERAGNAMVRRMTMLGKSAGPPWTTDHKAAALAASMVLCAS